MKSTSYKFVISVFATAAVYIAGAKLGLNLAFVNDQVTVVWPPTGIALGAILIFGYRMWPAIFIGAFIANYTTNPAILTSAGIGAGNTLEALIGARLMLDAGFRQAIDRFRDVLSLLVFGAIVAPAVSATVGVASLCASGAEPWSAFTTLWPIWLLGDSLGAMVVTPLILTAYSAFGTRLRPNVAAEFSAFLLALVAVDLLVFSGDSPLGPGYHPPEYAVFPLLIWSAIRFGTLGTAIGVFLTAGLAIWGTVSGFGPFVSWSVNESLISLQLYMAVVAITGNIIAVSRTERDAAEETFRREHTLLNAISEGSTDAMFIKDSSGRYLMINTAGASYIGKAREDVVNKDDQQLFSPQTARRLMDIDRYVLATGNTQVHEDPLTAGGVTRTYLSMKAPYRNAEGKIVGLIGIARDISDIKRIEQRYRSLVMASSQVVWTATATGDVVEDLPTWTAFTGQPPEEAKGRGWLRMLHPDDIDAVAKVWEESLQNRSPHENEFRVRSADGSYRHVLARAVPVLEPTGDVREWVGTLTDITERKLAETARQDANRHKDEFLAMLSHELRNPLAPMKNAVRLLQAGKTDSASVQWTAEIMDRQLRHMSRILDDLLDVSRIAQGQVQLRTERIDFRVLVQQSVDAARSLIESKNVTLVTTITSEAVPVQADPTRIDQITTNLLNNALKFTPQGGTIAVSLERVFDYAVLRVRDNGKGIPEKLLPHIFELFVQGDRSLGRSEGGLGIGLALVDRLVRMHGGKVEARSEGIDHGSEFIVRLPIALQEAKEALGPAPQPVLANRRKRVLIVEDDLDSAETLAAMLEMMGHQAQAVHDGEAAVAAIAREKPDVVLLDIGLPGMDGFAIGERIRSNATYNSVLLVALTGYGGDLDRARTKASGFDHHLIKPVEFEYLEKLLAL